MTAIDRTISDKWAVSNAAIQASQAEIPRTLMLELTNACNLRCTMCNNRNMRRTKGTMPLTLACRAIDEAAGIGIKELALFSTGEPLLYADLESVIRRGKSAGLYCYLTSNGLLLTPALAEMICKSGLDSFKFSIDSANKADYESVRVNGNFEKLIENVALLKTVRDRLGSQLNIICAAIKFPDRVDQIAEFKRIFGPLCDSILVSEMTNLGGKIEPAALANDTKRVKKPCRLLWDRIVLNYDGVVTACCVDFDAELVYGNFLRDSLRSIWNNTLMQKWRLLHLNQTPQLMPMCGHCSTPSLMDGERLQEINK